MVKQSQNDPVKHDIVSKNVNPFSNMNVKLSVIASANKNVLSKLKLQVITSQCNNQMRTQDMERLPKEIEHSYPGESAEIYFTRNLKQQADKTFKTTLCGKLVSKL